MEPQISVLRIARFGRRNKHLRNPIQTERFTATLIRVSNRQRIDGARERARIGALAVWSTSI
jgi:hypothetical protein